MNQQYTWTANLNFSCWQSQSPAVVISTDSSLYKWTTLCNILSNILHSVQFCTRIILKILRCEKALSHISKCWSEAWLCACFRSHLDQFWYDPAGFFNRFVNMDATGIHAYDPETKEHFKEWRVIPHVQRSLKTYMPSSKTLVSVFWFKIRFCLQTT